MIDYVVLGLVQGLTEFLPISSSGHLVLAERLLGFAPPGLIVEAALHLGTLASLLVVFRSDIIDLLRSFSPRGTIDLRKEIGYLILGTVPIVVAGLAMRGGADAWFRSLWVVGGGWLVTAGVLVVADRRGRRSRAALPSAAGAVVIGAAQALALAPGASRSGLSIGAGVLAGLRPERAARFSFLLAIPAVTGAAGLAIWDGLRAGRGPVGEELWGTLIGAAVAFGVGLAALRFLLAIVARGRLWPFAVYCAAASALSFSLALAGLS